MDVPLFSKNRGVDRFHFSQKWDVVLFVIVTNSYLIGFESRREPLRLSDFEVWCRRVGLGRCRGRGRLMTALLNRMMQELWLIVVLRDVRSIDDDNKNDNDNKSCRYHSPDNSCRVLHSISLYIFIYLFNCLFIYLFIYLIHITISFKSCSI